MTQISRIARLTLALALTVQTAALAERFTDRFEKTYAVSGDVEVKLGNTNGSVTIVAWGQATVQLVAEKSVESRSAEDAREVLSELEIVVDESRDRLAIETRQPSGTSGLFDWLFGRARNASVRYELRVPHGAELAVRTVNGSVTTEDAGGPQYLRSTNGRITVRGAQEAVEARTTNGSIQVEVVESPERLDVDLGSTNGGITLELPDDVRASLEARTVNGSVRSDLAVTVHGSTSKRRLSGDLNGGGAGQIGIRTTNGSIRIQSSTL